MDVHDIVKWIEKQSKKSETGPKSATGSFTSSDIARVADSQRS